MSLSSLLRQPNEEVLELSQQSTDHVSKYANTATSALPIPLISTAESADIWLQYEKLLLSCLRTGDDKAAHLCLEKLIDRFGATNERVMGLRGLYQEAVANDNAALARILHEYEEVLTEDPTNTPVAKRQIALLRSSGRPADAIDALVELLESSPTDIEAWTELSELYLSQGLFSQAIFCLEEVLLIAPNAWNIHARLGEILFVSTKSGTEASESRVLSEAIRRFCRSIELCNDYIRGHYGLWMTSNRLLVVLAEDRTPGIDMPESENGELSIISERTGRKLNEQATLRLAELVQKESKSSHTSAEQFAARDLLRKNTQAVIR